MSFLGALGNVGLFVGTRAKQGVTEMPQGAGLVLGTGDLPNCRQGCQTLVRDWSGIPPGLGSDPIRRCGFVCAHRWAGSLRRPQPVP